MTDFFQTLPTPDFWTEEEKKLWDTVVGLVIAIFLVGGASGLDLLPEGAAQIADDNTFNLAVITFLNTYRLDTIAGISATTADAAIKIITDWIASGDNLAALKASLTPLFGANRAEIIAITEITRIFAAGNKAAWLSTGLVAGLKWQTALDERVCFPAYTLVTTDTGDRPIQDVAPGDRVMTRKGWRKVKAASKRRYSGKMTGLWAGGRGLISTSDHPIWKQGSGWTRADGICKGDELQLLGNKSVDVRGLFHFLVGNANDLPAARPQISVLPGVSLSVLMPVLPVNLKSNAFQGHDEVHRIPSDFGLLNKRLTKKSKRKPNAHLKKVLPSKSSVAGNRTELPVTTWDAPELSPAILASDDYRRTAALLRAIMAVQMFLGPKPFSAPFASHVFGVGGSAFSTANGIPVGGRSIDGKDLATLWAKFFNPFGGASNIEARLRAILAPPVKLSPPNSPLASGTNRNLIRLLPNFIIAFARTISDLTSGFVGALKGYIAAGTNVLVRHGALLLSSLSVLYHKLFSMPIYVYDIQVEDVPEFYANGILVHNCPLCGPLHGVVIPITSRFRNTASQIANSPQMKAILGDRWTLKLGLQRARNLLKHSGRSVEFPPRHPRCRCYLLPVFSLSMFEERLDEILQL